MAKAKVAFVCGDCGAEHGKWQGQCASCGQWNTLREFILPATRPQGVGYTGEAPQASRLDDIETTTGKRLASGFEELDRVLGGGFVAGSVVLMGGDPGAGKSTLLLQVSTVLGDNARVLYISGEESLGQIADRARRLGLDTANLAVASEVQVERIAELVQAERPALVVVDSIQVMQVATSDSLPGSVTQVRESAAELVRLAKQTDIAVVLVGHVTKEGNLAGPKVLEHMIDCYMMLDAPAGSRYRTLRSLKNRFGAVNELGVFAMTDTGMKQVSNPSAIFLQRPKRDGARQRRHGHLGGYASAAGGNSGAGGHGPGRLSATRGRRGSTPSAWPLHLAVLHRHCGVSLADQDVFANVVGGVRIAETGADLALIVAAMSSFRSRVLPRDLVVFGELGLTGEVRPVPNGEGRLREAAQHGFTQAIVPAGQPAEGSHPRDRNPRRGLADPSPRRGQRFARQPLNRRGEHGRGRATRAWGYNPAMHCPFCSAYDTKVISILAWCPTETRCVAAASGLTCSERFTTFESAELLMPRVIKSNGAREPFNEDKLRAGLAPRTGEAAGVNGDARKP